MAVGVLSLLLTQAHAQQAAAGGTRTLGEVLRDKAAAWEGTADYGWRLYQDGSWRPIPAQLPMHGVLLVHGLDEPGRLWETTAKCLVGDGHAVLEFRYPNDQPVRRSAAFLRTSQTELRRRGAATAAVVAHSMGGLVVRELLTSPELGYPEGVRDGVLLRTEALIMVGTPNYGSAFAGLRVVAEMRDQWTRFLRGEGRLLGALTDGLGEAATDLTPGSEFLTTLNARPPPAGVRLTIIAGIASPLTRERLDRTLATWAKDCPEAAVPGIASVGRGLGEVVDGIGDGVVSLASARLAGVNDLVVVKGDHLGMLCPRLPWSEELPPAVPIIRDRLRARTP